MAVTGNMAQVCLSLNGLLGLPALGDIKTPDVLRRLGKDPELELGETYMEGGWHCGDGDLQTLLQVLMTNFSQPRPKGVRRIVAAAMKLLQRGNRIYRSYQNVAHHYDLDEWLFRLFLDDGMFYSCAYYEYPGQSLEAAQQAKCELLRKKLKPGQRVLDIGSGWGGLAFYLAEQADVEVIGLTLSKEQLRVAQHQARVRGLDNQVRFYLEDYRQHSGKYDRIVSVGMFEHVGRRHFMEFFRTVERLLQDDGVTALHTIGCMDTSTETNPWIKRHIFPGGFIPALSEISQCVEKTSLFSTDVEILRIHYADTLAEWLRRFRRHREEVEARLGETFYRMWEFYLAGTEATFRWWDLVVFHLQMAQQHGVVPVTRDYLMQKDDSHAESLVKQVHHAASSAPRQTAAQTLATSSVKASGSSLRDS